MKRKASDTRPAFWFVPLDAGGNVVDTTGASVRLLAALLADYEFTDAELTAGFVAWDKVAGKKSATDIPIDGTMTYESYSGGTLPVLGGEGTVVATDAWYYLPEVADFATAGDWIVEVEVTFADASTQTYPLEGFYPVRVIEDVG